jgi:hypothetical protein
VVPFSTLDSIPPVPKGQRNAILEGATRRGIIPGYRVLTSSLERSRYEVAGSDITVEVLAPCANSAGCRIEPTFWIEYGRPSSAKAQRLAEFAQARWRWNFKSFEVTQGA